VREDVLKNLRYEFEDAIHGPTGAELDDDEEVRVWLSVEEIKALLRLLGGVRGE
jgi:hypothetical protein